MTASEKDKGESLRHRAQKRLETFPPLPADTPAARGASVDGPDSPTEAPNALVEELRIHHAELLVQNEELQRSEAELYATRARYVDLYDRSPVGHVTLSRKGEILEANLRAADMLRCERDALVGTSLFPRVALSGRDTLNRHLRADYSADESIACDLRLVADDGAELWVKLESIRLQEGGEEPTFRTVFSDIEDRQRATAERDAARDLLQATIDGMPDSILVVTLDHDVSLMNRAARARLGPRAASREKLTCHEATHGRSEPCDRNLIWSCPMREVRRTRRPATATHRHADSTGGLRIYEVTASPLFDEQGDLYGVVEVSRDITERVAIEEELFRTRKLESIGVLAGGIAHDFNNLLTAILGNLTFARETPGIPEEAMDALGEVQVASERARALTTQLLTFAKGGAPVKRLTSIADLIRDSATFISRGSANDCHFEIPDDLWGLEVDEGQLSQVIGNLVLNAIQASPQGGSIRVRATNVDQPPAPDDSLDEGPYVRIEVEDDGPGIPPDRITRIFDPYYSTKEEGSGLGLATAHSIIARHGGRLDVRSRIDEGSVFSILLPSTGTSAPNRVTRKRSPAPGTGRILVMDDDDDVRNFARTALERLGYECELVGEGEAMLEAYRRGRDEGRPFAAVILDLTVPGGMGGRQAVERLLVLDPEARAIASSGYFQGAVMSDYERSGFVGVLPKPYGVARLSEVLRSAIVGPTGAAGATGATARPRAD